MLANPVSFAFDEKGRCFVAETFRLHHGVTDNRGHMNWLDDDLASPHRRRPRRHVPQVPQEQVRAPMRPSTTASA